MSRSSLATINRVINFSLLSYALVYTIRWPPLDKTPNPTSQSLGPWRFFTNWNLALQTLFYFCCLYKQFTSRIRIDGRAQTKRGLFYHAVIFPSAIIVCSTFWGLWYIDRELIFPSGIEKYIPMHLNHILHTLILPGMLLEGALFNHPFPKIRSALASFCLVGFSYIGLCLWMGIKRNYWVYPFLAVMDLKARLLFFVVTLISGTLLLKSSKVYHSIFWSKGPKQAKKKSAKD